MKRLLIIPAFLAACGVAPEDLETRTSEVTDLTLAGCAALDDALTAAIIDVASEVTGTAKGVEAIRARRKLLCDAAAIPVADDGELSPVPVAKRTDS